MMWSIWIVTLGTVAAAYQTQVPPFPTKAECESVIATQVPFDDTKLACMPAMKGDGLNVGIVVTLPDKK